MAAPRAHGVKAAIARLSRGQLAVMTVVILASIIGLAALVLLNESRVADSDRRLFDQSRAIDRNGTIDGAILAGDPSDPARARVSDALSMARAAATMPPSPQRLQLLDEALALVEEARVARPHWGEASIVRAFTLQQRNGEFSPATIDAIAESYRFAPYLKLSAVWRSGIVMANWDRMDGATRNRMMEEAIAISLADRKAQVEIFAHARQSPAYTPLMSRWYRAQVGRFRRPVR